MYVAIALEPCHGSILHGEVVKYLHVLKSGIMIVFLVSAPHLIPPPQTRRASPRRRHTKDRRDGALLTTQSLFLKS